MEAVAPGVSLGIQLQVTVTSYSNGASSVLAT